MKRARALTAQMLPFLSRGRSPRVPHSPRKGSIWAVCVKVISN